MIRYQGQFRTDRATMYRLFGEPNENGNYVLDIGGRKANVFSKYGSVWTVEAENQKVYSKLITKIQIES